MKYYYGIFATIAAGFSFLNAAQAADINFNFLVNSSGSDLYACDAGIYDPLFLLPIGVRGSAAQSNIQARVGAYNNGNPISIWNDLMIQSNTILPPPPGFHTVAYPSGYPGFTTPVIDRLNTVIANSNAGTSAGQLTFNLASDYYGARYFVDFCFRGSQLPYPPGEYEYHVRDVVSATDLGAGTYLTDADLEVQGKLVCEERSSSGSENWSTTTINDLFAIGLLGLDGVPLSQTHLTTANDFNGTAQNVFGSIASPHEVPLEAPAKFCVLRYIFREQAIAKRKWDLNSANFTIDLHVNNVSYTPVLP
ncbi:MAG: hypothetical protein FJY29_05905 [Betaproteobacteria bacterium]|nr:hypothetical protein [Betaproteobacteria bacterium]